VLLVLFLQAGACLAQNLAQNPGFETGNTSGWFAFGPATISAQSTTVHSGSYAGRVQNRTAAWNGIGQALLGVVQPGQLCNLSAWVRLVSGADQTVQMTVKKVDGNGSGYSAVASGTVSTGGWTQVAGQYTLEVSGTLTELTLYLEVPTSTNAAFYVDDLVVEVVGSGNAGGEGQSTINWQEVHQRIDGFGASSAWRSTWTTTQADMFFSTNSGIGLSLLRNRIAPDGTTWETSIMQMAQARGARVWSVAWSPPADLKDSGTVNGGNFRGGAVTNQIYAGQLARYVANMSRNYGVNIYALSVQNESDYSTTNYESCVWTPQQIHDFVPYLSAALAASNAASTKIMLPESMHWQSNTNLYTTAMNDPAVAALVGIIANHNYDGIDFNHGATASPAQLPNYGKPTWQTEVGTGASFDGSISDGLYWGSRIHQFMTVAQANAWHYWWLIDGNLDANGGLTDQSGNPAKRMYVLGNFSRFVRPGCYRIGVSNNASPLQISAYKDTTSRAFAIVAINPTTTNISQVFNLNGFTVASSVTPWLTSASASLVAQAAVAVGGRVFTNIIPAQSVVTLVGVADPGNSAPSLAPVSNLAASSGVTLTVTNTASDPDIPAQILTFSLLSGPTGATLNATNGVFSWRPLVSQAGSTNVVTVAVADTGTPVLSATNSYTITVGSLAPAALSSVTQASDRLSLIVTGPLGPDYTLLTSTNLAYWQPLLTTNPAAMPFSLMDASLGDAARFYRLQLGP
jgi:glucuronoarabinoxylan endo-1,4-beta-xylanase